MSNLSNRLYAWALNEEMIDTHLTEHGCDCVSASELLVQQDAEIERLREELSHCLHLDNHNAIVRNLQEAAVVVTAEKDAEIERLRKENERLWSLCRSVYGNDRYIREALGE